MDVISTCTAAAEPLPPAAPWFVDHGRKPAAAADAEKTGRGAAQVNRVAGLSHGNTKPVPNFSSAVSRPLPPTNSRAPDRPLHRLGEARRRERVSRRKVAQRLGISGRQVKEQEQPSSDMLLSNLYRWQEVLEVPLVELLHEPDGELSPPVQLRARLLRAMKTVRSIQRGAQQTSIRRLATMLVEQLVEIMPELKNIVPWPAASHRRSHKIEPFEWYLDYERRWT